MSISDADIVRAATSLGVIGGSTQSAHRILAALCDTTLGSREIAELIQREPGLTVRVLKVANSAYYGRSRDISTLEHALVVLGLDAVRGITAAACLDRSIARRSPPAAIDPTAIVNHSVASAFAAEALAKTARRSSVSESFMAAFLHDFGVPNQERLDTDRVAKLIGALRDQPESNAAALEQSLVKIGHAYCAQVVFDAWRLPPAIALAVSHHDDPGSAPEAARELTTLVHLGIQLAIDAGFTHPLEPRQFRIPRGPLLESLQLDAEVVAPIVETLPERVLLLAQAAG
jgi:HD-like signal output (HDOD) protein